jgi:hypothetical protein
MEKLAEKHKNITDKDKRMFFVETDSNGFFALPIRLQVPLSLLRLSRCPLPMFFFFVFADVLFLGFELFFVISSLGLWSCLFVLAFSVLLMDLPRPCDYISILSQSHRDRGMELNRDEVFFFPQTLTLPKP